MHKIKLPRKGQNLNHSPSPDRVSGNIKKEKLKNQLKIPVLVNTKMT